MDICVAGQGVVAAVLSDKSATKINVYDKEGNQLAGMKCTMIQTGYPFDISLSPSGTLLGVSYVRMDGGELKSSIAFYTLLNEGIGNTIRVSLSSGVENEVIAGLNILKECGKRKGGVNLISCPRCGRIGFDVHSFVDRWQKKLMSMNKDISVAVMGCVVNGPGEGRHADLGIAGGGDKCIIFKKGKIVRTIDSKDADKVFEEEINCF